MNKFVIKGIFIFTIFIILSFYSCVSMSIVKSGFSNEKILAGSKIACNELNVISLSFQDSDDLKQIFTRSLNYELQNQKKLILIDNIENADYYLVPEIVIKKFAENFQDYYYYSFSVEIMKAQTKIAHFVYNYTGTMSIFNDKLMRSMIRSFIHDFLKIVSNK
jgi:hypothetical protein